MRQLARGAVVCAWLVVAAAVPQALAAHVNVVTISGSINPAGKSSAAWMKSMVL